MMRRFLSLTLVLMLIISACSVASFAEEEVYQFHKYEEPVTLTTHKVITTSNVFCEGDSVENNGLTRWYEDALGIKWEMAWTTGDSESDQQKLDLAFASDDLPDVINPTISQLAKYVAAGKILPLDDLIEEYASPLVKWAIQDAIDVSGGAYLAPVTIGGKIYALPQMADSLAWWTNNFIRTDILAELGGEIPTTLAELEALCDKYIEKYPGSYPIAFSNDIQGLGSSATTVLTAFGAYMDMWDEDENGQLVYTSIQPEMKAALGRLAEWYQKGYIDPEFVVNDSGKKDEVIAAGDWLFDFGYWWSIANFCNTWANVEGSDISAVPFLAGDDGTCSMMTESWWSSITAITTSCEHPEAAIYALNATWDSYYRNDPELREILAAEGYNFHYPVTEVQEAWNIDEVNEKYSYVAEPKLLWKFNYDEELEGPVYLNDYYCRGNVFYGFYGSLSTPSNNAYKSMSEAVKAGFDTSLLTPEAQDTWTGWYASDPKMLSTFATSYDIWSQQEFKVNKFCTSDTPTMIEKGAYLDKLELECFTAIIMGTKPIDAFDQFVEDWKNNGGDQITQEVNEWYATTK